MKILIDIGHPAHVHYFKNFISILKNEGHAFKIVARDRPPVFELLKSYNLEYVTRGKGKNSFFGKLFYLFYADFKMIIESLKFKPDLLIGFGSPYIAHASFFIGKPSIILDDTDHAKLNHLFYTRFASAILTPKSFRRDFGKKQFRFNGFIEQTYLMPKYFKPDESILNELGVKPNEKFVLLRFISWTAGHDIGHKGLTIENKTELISEIKKHANVFISSEDELPEQFKQYQVKIAANRIHDVLFFAHLFVGEGGTMASECAMLGTPAIFVNSLLAKATAPGTHLELRDFGLMDLFVTFEGVVKRTQELLSDNGLKEIYREKKNKMMAQKDDITEYMVQFVKKEMNV